MALFIFLFLDWFGPASAWEVFDVMDVLLAIVGLGAAGLVAARLAGVRLGLPAPAIVLALDGFAAAVVALTFILEGEERKIGVWLAFLAALGMVYGGYMATRERVGGAPPRPTPPAPGGPPPPA